MALPLDRQDARFLIGALGHGMDFEQALPLYQGFQQERAADKELKGGLANQGVSWIMEGQDPATVGQGISAIGRASGLPKPMTNRLSKMLGNVGNVPGQVAQPTPADVERFTAMTPYLQSLAELSAYKETGPEGLLNRKALRDQAMSHFGIQAGDRPVMNQLLDQWYENTIAGQGDDAWQRYQQAIGGGAPEGGGGGNTAANAIGGLGGAAAGAGLGAAYGSVVPGLGTVTGGIAGGLGGLLLSDWLFG